jgi:hypothetical protein
MTRSDFQLVVKNSGLRSTSSADNYMRVAENEFLRKPAIMEHLPVGIGALIDVAAWTEMEVEACIRDKTMHPHVERKTLRNWIDQNRVHQEPVGPTYQSYVPVLIIEVDPDRWAVEDQERLHSWLRKHLEEEFPDQMIQVSRPREGSDWPVKMRRRWEIHVKIRDQTALIDTLPTKDAISKALSDCTDEADALLGQILSSPDCDVLREAAKLTVADMAFLGVTKGMIGQPPLTRFFAR